MVPEDAPKPPTKAQVTAWGRFGNLMKPTKAQVEANERTSEAIRWWAEFQATNEGKDRIDPDDVAEAQRCIAGLHADPKCAAFLSLPGLSEVAIEWTDEATGIPCKAKLDRVTANCVLDLKSAADASADGFKNAAFRYGYHRQAAWYLDGLAMALEQGTPPPAVAELLKAGPPSLFVFPTVEKDDEHLAHLFVASDGFIERGRAENAELMADLKTCLDTDTWPGLARDKSGMTALELPAWAQKQTENNQ